MRQTGELPDWLIAGAIRKRRSEFNDITLFVVSSLDFYFDTEQEKLNPLASLRRWGIALRHEPTSKVRASCLTATADPAVAAALERVNPGCCVLKEEEKVTVA